MAALADISVELPPPAPAERQTYQQRFSALKPFIIISSSYLLYTTTDGAVRMIVLLQAYLLGFTAWQVAVMFTLYELAGVVTNLLAGVMGAKWGIKTTLLTGLSLQLFGIGMLYGWQSDWSQVSAIAYVTVSQMLCGIAKDLTKLGGKTVTKLVTPEEKQSSLFKLVSLITGWKNSLKGAGYFLGAVTVAWSYNGALTILMALIVVAMPWAVFGLSKNLGRTAKENATLRKVFQMNYNVNMLSAARMFLFGSRDAWFEVPLPFFLRDQIVGLGWSRPVTGAFLGAFIIIYGQMQSWTPQLVTGPLRQSPANKYVAELWVALMSVCPAVMAAFCLGSSIFQDHDVNNMTIVLVTALAAFCILFAINSAVHSYLILRYSEGNKVAMNVGFYYMANAMGRLIGTLSGGALYSFAGGSNVDGFGWCFVLATLFCVACMIITPLIKDNQGGLACGPCMCIAAPEDDSVEGTCDAAAEDTALAEGGIAGEDKRGERKAPVQQGSVFELGGPAVGAADLLPLTASDTPDQALHKEPSEQLGVQIASTLSASLKHNECSVVAESADAVALTAS